MSERRNAGTQQGSGQDAQVGAFTVYWTSHYPERADAATLRATGIAETFDSLDDALQFVFTDVDFDAEQMPDSDDISEMVAAADRLGSPGARILDATHATGEPIRYLLEYVPHVGAFFLTSRSLDGWDVEHAANPHVLVRAAADLPAVAGDSALVVDDATQVVVWRATGEYVSTDAPLDPPLHWSLAHDEKTRRGSIVKRLQDVADEYESHVHSVPRERARRIRRIVDSARNAVEILHRSESVDLDRIETQVEDLRAEAAAILEGR